MINNCWIAPDGEIIKVEWHRHGRAANEILGEALYPEHAILKLANQGYLHIGSAEFVSPIPWSKITDAQRESLYTVLAQCTSLLIHANITSYIHT